MDILLIFSLFSLGFFGGFSHCIGMCGPFVMTQVGSRLSKIDINNYNNFSRLKNLSLLPYHLGRITTYSILGGLSSLITNNIQNQIGFKIISFIFLILAILIFIRIFFNSLSLNKFGLFFKSKSINLIVKDRSHFRHSSRSISSFKEKDSCTTKCNRIFSSKLSILRSKYLKWLLSFTIRLKNTLYFLEKRITFLFNNPTNIKGYFLGVILGFIPCGLLYGAFLISANMGSFFAGMVGMAVFGIATFPALFVTALGFDLFKKSNFFKVITKIFILINIATLSLMAVSQLSF